MCGEKNEEATSIVQRRNYSYQKRKRTSGDGRLKWTEDVFRRPNG